MGRMGQIAFFFLPIFILSVHIKIDNRRLMCGIYLIVYRRYGHKSNIYLCLLVRSASSMCFKFAVEKKMNSLPNPLINSIDADPRINLQFVRKTMVNSNVANIRDVGNRKNPKRCYPALNETHTHFDRSINSTSFRHCTNECAANERAISLPAEQIFDFYFIYFFATKNA